MKIKVKKLVPEAVVPKFVYDTDAGADLTAISSESKDDLIIYGTGLAFEIPEGYCMKIYPRSSIFKYDLELVNSVGVIDSQYRGEVKFMFRVPDFFMKNKLHDEFLKYCHPRHNYETLYDNIKIYNIGDRIGQAIIEKLVPTEYIEVEELDMNNDRGGGFGSTGV